jgi:multicomponent Na+:H+ antiporter subunit E
MPPDDALKPAPVSGRGARFVVAVLPWRLLIAALVWIVLTAGDPSSIAVGVPVVAGSALASALLLPRLPWSPRAIAHFALYFLLQSLRGGFDVARRAFDPRLPLAPGIVEYRFRLEGELPRVALTNTISLLPGTLGADMDDTHLYVHALDTCRDVRGGIERAEQRIAALFGLTLAARADDA